ncbi:MULTISPECIES: Maf family protein [unclassified Halomonas]|uniref:Maf family protein n=1 Tax=unclassified Halomonas TaxID=2609666 RepID=UPI0006DB32B5|nr:MULTISPECIES: nucleoside triphosphate pyrophosphatase [unclassified Halomonas]KPQ20122.1 MAG: septum formation protein Maf [Halomonas sp. HL-93]SBR49529.1 MAF protein [Halomonas sp. HL-93]SNY96416.1 MAF protein [Halomonas sp. hl-4]
MPNATPELVLASSSRSRRELLDRLQMPYQCYSPDIDETPQSGETPHQLVHRLALSKATAVADRFAHHCIIGSDQVAVFEGDILGKPHTIERAEHNLRRFSGQRVTFLTGLALLDTRQHTHQAHVEPFEVVFRKLSDAEIRVYVNKERPLDSAGSFRMEGLGISLFERLEGRDPNALIGLPLIALCNMLRQAGLDPLGAGIDQGA